MSENWLEKLKVGDVVVLDDTGWIGPCRMQVATVSRTTKTQVEINGLRKYRRKNGWGVGNHRLCIVEATEELVEEIQQEHKRRHVTQWLIDNFFNRNLYRITTEELQQIRAIVETALAREDVA